MIMSAYAAATIVAEIISGVPWDQNWVQFRDEYDDFYETLPVTLSGMPMLFKIAAGEYGNLNESSTLWLENKTDKKLVGHYLLACAEFRATEKQTTVKFLDSLTHVAYADYSSVASRVTESGITIVPRSEPSWRKSSYEFHGDPTLVVEWKGNQSDLAGWTRK